MRGRDRLIEERNIHVFLGIGGDFMQCRYLSFWFLSWSSVSCLGSWKVCHLIWKLDYNEIRGYLVVTLPTVLDQPGLARSPEEKFLGFRHLVLKDKQD